MLALGKEIAVWVDGNAMRSFLFQRVIDNTSAANQGDTIYDSTSLTIATVKLFDFKREDKIIICGEEYMIQAVTRLRRKYTLDKFYLQLALVR